jgi:hypothetical protein
MDLGTREQEAMSCVFLMSHKLEISLGFLGRNNEMIF